MAVSDRVFDITALRHGSGWEAVHVQLKHWCTPVGKAAANDTVVLTADAVTPEEFDQLVDELIEQLQRLKPKARRKIRALRKQGRTW